MISYLFNTMISNIHLTKRNIIKVERHMKAQNNSILYTKQDHQTSDPVWNRFGPETCSWLEIICIRRWNISFMSNMYLPRFMLRKLDWIARASTWAWFSIALNFNWLRHTSCVSCIPKLSAAVQNNKPEQYLQIYRDLSPSSVIAAVRKSQIS